MPAARQPRLEPKNPENRPVLSIGTGAFGTGAPLRPAKDWARIRAMTTNENGYELLDSGGGRKLERFGRVVLARPCAQAVWRPALPEAEWARADASFDREDGNRWQGRGRLPDHWTIEVDGTAFHLSATDFGHLGIFPEQRAQWAWFRGAVAAAAAASGEPPAVLNLFAYSGGSSLACARAGARVTHLDASRGMVDWAAENAKLNGLGTIRWIVDDAHKFLRREARRGRRYDGVILDPPSFGRGAGGETYVIERDLVETLDLVRAVLSERPRFVLLSAHTPGCSPQVLENVLRRACDGLGGAIASGEMLLEGAPGVLPLPSGDWARWTAS